MTSPIASFTDEVLLYFFSFLAPEDVSSVSRVSRQWRRLSEDISLWQGLLCRVNLFYVANHQSKFSHNIKERFISFWRATREFREIAPGHDSIAKIRWLQESATGVFRVATIWDASMKKRDLHQRRQTFAGALSLGIFRREMDIQRALEYSITHRDQFMMRGCVIFLPDVIEPHILFGSLCYSLQQHQFQLAEWLIDRGSPIDWEVRQGLTLYELFLAEQNQAVVDFLEQKMASLTIT